MTKHYELEVIGRVQGVGYRYFCLNKAREYKIKGYVKNLPNGNVKLEIECEQKAFINFLSELYKGPKFARVDKISQVESQVIDYTDFKIR